MDEFDPVKIFLSRLDPLVRLRAENDKLRALVRGLDYCSDELNSAECDKCPLHDPADPNLEPKCVRMMRELEIDKEKYNG